MGVICHPGGRTAAFALSIGVAWLDLTSFEQYVCFSFVGAVAATVAVYLIAPLRKSQSRTSYVGSWTTSASLACSRSKVPSSSVVARTMMA
jgi:ABC-type Fe3+-siderophore transport system permease subunit